MAKVGFSGGVESIRGKAGTGIYKKSLGGFSYKQYQPTPNLKTNSQLEVRNAMVFLNAKWKTLSNADRQTWRVDYTYEGKKYNGFSLFILRSFYLYYKNDAFFSYFPGEGTKITAQATKLQIPNPQSPAAYTLVLNNFLNANSLISLRGTKFNGPGRDATKYLKYFISIDQFTTGQVGLDIDYNKFRDFYGKPFLNSSDNIAIDVVFSDSFGTPQKIQSNIPLEFL